MTKGKYAARANLRREDSEVRGDIDTYQRTVARLTAENKLLKEQVRLTEAARRAETRRLRAERDEGLSPEVSALRKELNAQRQRADTALAQRREQERRSEKVATLAWLLVHKLTGCTGLEANEFLLRILEGERKVIVGGGGLGQDSRYSQIAAPDGTLRARPGTETLQRVRGYRSGPEVVARLDALAESLPGEIRKVRSPRSSSALPRSSA